MILCAFNQQDAFQISYLNFWYGGGTTPPPPLTFPKYSAGQVPNALWEKMSAPYTSVIPPSSLPYDPSKTFINDQQFNYTFLNPASTVFDTLVVELALVIEPSLLYSLFLDVLLLCDFNAPLEFWLILDEHEICLPGGLTRATNAYRIIGTPLPV